MLLRSYPKYKNFTKIQNAFHMIKHFSNLQTDTGPDVHSKK